MPGPLARFSKGPPMKTTLALCASAVALAASLHAAPARAGAVLDRVKAAGVLRCGVLTEPDDWGKDDVHAPLPELGEDYCRAAAAAVLGSPDRVKIVDAPSEQVGFRDLAAGKVDLLMGASPSAASSVAYGVSFVRPVFLDGDALMVHRESGIHSFADLKGRTVCYIMDTEAAAALNGEAARRGVAFKPWNFEENGELLAAVVGRSCDAYFNSATRLAEARTNFHARTKDFDILPERYSVLPLAPAVASGDALWAEVVDAVAAAPVRAEAGGVDKAHADLLRTTEDPLLRPLGGTLTGIDPEVVDDGWAARAVGAVGNAAEIFTRDLGEGSDLKLPRGANALWTQGGLMVPEAPH